MRVRLSIMLLLLALLPLKEVYAQIAGMDNLSILDMTNTARTAGLGMDYLPLRDNDINVAVDNPSMLGKEMNRALSFNYVGLFNYVGMGQVTYARDLNRFGTFAATMKYHNYGIFRGYDEYDNETGKFYAADICLMLNWGFHIDSNFSFGVNVKPVYSQYESYSALAIAFDMAASYVSKNQRFAVTAIGRNVGAQFFFGEAKTDWTPFELSAALSYKLKNAPFRFFLALTELQQWNLMYEDPLNPSSTTDPFTGEVTKRSGAAKFFDNGARHVLVAVELNIGKVFFLRFGYNYRQMREMYGATGFNASGFSYGVGLKIKGFEFAYSRNNYHQMQAPNYITITTNLDRFTKK